MPLTASPIEVAAAFTATAFPDPSTESEAYSVALQAFIDIWFLAVESDLIEPYASTPLPLPPPNWLPNITDSAVREWATALHSTWGTLCRTAAPEVSLNPSFYSLLPVPGPFIVPGARFREGYYWDSFWAVKGLLVSGLDHLATNVVLNLVHCVNTHGFVPNGLRSYYLNRSQPPLLAAMVEAVWESTKDREFLITALPALDKELTWWRQGPRSSRVCVLKSSRSNSAMEKKEFLLTRYCANWRQPRPESLQEDIATVRQALLSNRSYFQHINEEEKLQKSRVQDIFCDIASAAESGWDFSSRWFGDGKTLSTIGTSKIYPADLNALLYKAEKTIAALAATLGEGGTLKKKEESEKMALKWSAAAEERLQTINELHWDHETNRWRDFALKNTSSRSNDAHAHSENTFTLEFISNQTSSNTTSIAIYASDYIPLWCGCALPNSSQAVSAIQSLKESGLISIGGVAASTIETGEQWDWPNAWPPLQAMLSEGCEQYGGSCGGEVAEEIARKFLKTAFAAWKMTGRMFEKFDVREIGVQGGGGEYACMDGFGWTNGVALMWLDKYGWREEE
jgi:alpha,alpha-trehalase